MDKQFFEVLGKYAGLGGFSVGLILLVITQVVKTAKPTGGFAEKQSYSLLRTAMLLTFGVGVLGICAWTIVTLAARPGSTSSFTVSGHVKDPNSLQPINDADVSINGGTEETRTNPEGNFTMSFANSSGTPKVTLSVRKEGYIPSEVVAASRDNLAIGLKALSPAVPSDTHHSSGNSTTLNVAPEHQVERHPVHQASEPPFDAAVIDFIKRTPSAAYSWPQYNNDLQQLESFLSVFVTYAQATPQLNKAEADTFFQHLTSAIAVVRERACSSLPDDGHADIHCVKNFNDYDGIVSFTRNSIADTDHAKLQSDLARVQEHLPDWLSQSVVHTGGSK